MITVDLEPREARRLIEALEQVPDLRKSDNAIIEALRYALRMKPTAQQALLLYGTWQRERGLEGLGGCS